MPNNKNKGKTLSTLTSPATPVAVGNTGLTESSVYAILDNNKKLLSEKGELARDIRDIVLAVSEFALTSPLPTKFNFMWVVANYKAIIKLITKIVTILKTKGHIVNM